MYNRLLLKELAIWKDKTGRKPLVLRGARQVGKTTLVNEFSKQFDHYIYLNLELADDASVFVNYTKVEDVVNFLFLRQRINKQSAGATLIFIDEIQEEPRAIEMLRYFYEETPWVYVIAAGSRLQSLVKKHISFPVGRVEYMSLRPFSFKEYLNAALGEDWVDILERRRIDTMLHEQFMKLFNEYALVGGMPEAVSTYLKTKDIESLSPIYRSLQNGYSEDIERYAKSPAQAAILRHVLRHGWAFAGQAIKFAKFAGSEYTSTQVHEVMDILQKAFLLSLDYPVTSAQAPAIPSYSHSPKLIWVDSGMVNFFADIQIDYLQNADLLSTWRGYAAEQIVAQELRVVLDRHYRDEQYFWVRNKKGANAEVDYVWQYGQHIIPIEVKAGTNSHLRSLHSFINNSQNTNIAIRVWSGEYFVQETKTPAPFNKPFRLINLPFYLVGSIDNIVEEEIKK